MLSKKPIQSIHYFAMDLALLGMIFLIFYTFYLGGYPLFTPDEGRYSEVAREMIATSDYITPRVNGVAFLDKPILYYWLQAAAMKLFGINEWALRFFPALAGVLGSLVTYLCGRLLFDRRTGFISAALLATTPLYFIGAHYANLDLEVAVLISCTLLFFITGVQSKGISRHAFLILAYVSAALAFLTKGLIGIAFPAMIAGMWILLLGEFRLLTRIHLIKGIVLFSLIILPWYYLVQRANPEFLHYFFVTQQVTRFLSTAEFNNPTPFWFYLPVILIGFFPFTCFLTQACVASIKRVWAARHSHQTELFLLIWAIVVFGFFSIPRSKMITYILPVFPALALLSGHYLSSKWHDIRQKNLSSGIFAIITISLITAITLICISHYHWINLPADFSPYLNLIAIIFILNALLSLLFSRQKTLLPLLIVNLCCNVLLLSTLTIGAKHFNQNSVKPLVANLKPLLQPQDEVVNYFKFYQDLPVYLGQRITIVANWNSPSIPYHDNWLRELWIGMPFQDTTEWLINENTFWKRWNSSKRMFVFVGHHYLAQFHAHTRHYYTIGQANGILLLSNKPIKP